PEPLLRVAGLDLLDGTPVFDIKPYLPYADAIADATGGFAPGAPEARWPVVFGAQAEADLARVAVAEELRALIGEVLALDPRPAYRQGEEPERVYGVRLGGYDVRWRVVGDRIEVQAVQAADPA
ncbi:MAG: TrmO family methyltransferase, partial [Sedimenticolaceae bacterium]